MGLMMMIIVIMRRRRRGHSPLHFHGFMLLRFIVKRSSIVSGKHIMEDRREIEIPPIHNDQYRFDDIRLIFFSQFFSFSSHI